VDPEFRNHPFFMLLIRNSWCSLEKSIALWGQIFSSVSLPQLKQVLKEFKYLLVENRTAISREEGLEEQLIFLSDLSEFYIKSIQHSSAYQSVYLFCFYMYNLILPLTGFFGLLGNLLNIVVLSQKNLRRKVFYNLLCLLSFFDIIVIVSIILTIMQTHGIFLISSYLLLSFRSCGIYGSIYTLVAVSFERYLSIHHPFLEKRRKVYVYLIPIMFIVLCFITAVDVNSYSITALDYNSFTKNRNFQPLFEMLTRNGIFYSSFTIRYYGIFQLWIPLICLIILNGSIILKLRSKQKLLKQSYKGRSSGILLCMVLLFFICCIPSLFRCLVVYIVESEKVVFYACLLICLFYFGFVLNSSLNFLVYSIAGKKFRTELNIIFTSKLRTSFCRQGDGQEEIVLDMITIQK